MIYKTSPIVMILMHVHSVVADVYLHSPPGCNNRLDEANRERNNANRMFDSENNNRGGYNVGKVQYYEGEKVPIMWTNQHGSSPYQMEHTEFVLQYMCDPLLRDGTTTNTIPEKPIDCQNFDCDTDVRFGRHESYEYYKRCESTARNLGLFTANQNLNGNSAKHTRQNPGGTRHGYECPEERDYYPYWRPSKWVDMAYITNNIERCDEIKAESQNVKSKWECRLDPAFYELDNYEALFGNNLYPINEAECQDFQIETTDRVYNSTWTEVAAFNVAAPECKQAQQTRANHLGLVGGRQQYTYEWTVPKLGAQDRCVLRLRYNITTNEYTAWKDPALLKAGLNSTANSKKSKPNANNDPAEVDMWTRFGLEESDMKDSNGAFKNNDDSREYFFRNNPQVEMMKPTNGDEKYSSTNGAFRFKLQLAVNTAQFGRGFQDRSHVFRIEPRPDSIPEDAEIKLQTVSGKRGNIVQTFPAHEYFFVPEVAYLETNDYIHHMWTGSNTNPNNNDGQGKQGTDRSNLVPLRVQKYDITSYSDFPKEVEYDGLRSEPRGGNGETGSLGMSYPAYIREPQGYRVPDARYGQGAMDDITLRDNILVGALGGMSQDYLEMLATSRQAPLTDFGNMEELDDASTSVNLPPQKVIQKGCWNFVSTRNNNFSNRSQKGKMCVHEGTINVQTVGVEGADIWTKHGDVVYIWPDSLESVNNIRVESVETTDGDVATISNMDLKEGKVMTLHLRYSPKSLHHPRAMWRHTPEDDWTELEDVQYVQLPKQGHVAKINHDEEGEYKVEHKANVPAFLGLIVGSLAFVCAISYVAYKKCFDER